MEIVEKKIVNDLWKTDPNAYARNQYKQNSLKIIDCKCGQQIKKCFFAKHLKSKNHKSCLFVIEKIIKKNEGLGIICL